MSSLHRPIDLCQCEPQRMLGWHQPIQAFFLYDTNYKVNLQRHQNTMLLLMPYQKEDLAGLMPAKPSFGMTTTKIMRPVFARQGSFEKLLTTENWTYSTQWTIFNCCIDVVKTTRRELVLVSFKYGLPSCLFSVQTMKGYTCSRSASKK